MQGAIGLFLATLAVMGTSSPVLASGKPSEVRLLMSSPQCVVQRLGQVTVSIGSKEPNLRTGMRPAGVSYKNAFDKLLQAAADRGGNAVVLREHQADYFTKGARRSRRPTYVSLQGAVVVLAHEDRCSLAVIDPSEFERDVVAKQRVDVAKNTGVSF